MHRLKIQILLLAILLGAFTVGLFTTSFYTKFGVQKDCVLSYKYWRISTSDQKYQKGEVTYHVLMFTQQEILVEISDYLDCSIRYKDGLPVYAERLEAMFYLPNEAVKQSLDGNFDWALDIDSPRMGISNATGQVLNFTVESGTFKCLNVTLSVTGMDSGNLSFLFDLNSGVMVYEQFIPSYGDVIIQELSSSENSQLVQLSPLLITSVSLTTFAFLVAIAILYNRRKSRASGECRARRLKLCV